MNLSGGKGYSGLKAQNYKVGQRADATNTFNSQLAADIDTTAAMRGYRSPGAFEGLASMSTKELADDYNRQQQSLSPYYANVSAANNNGLEPNSSSVPKAVDFVPSTTRSGNNDNVVALQAQLNSEGAKLKVDGINGPKTQAALFESLNKQDPEVVAYNNGDKSQYVPGNLQETDMRQVPKGLAAKANGLDESIAYWQSNQAPEGYVPRASYNSFSDMFK
jgi:hypothetical protein